MDKFKYIFIGVLLLGAFLLGRQCSNKPKVIENTKTETIHKTDTIYPDTVFKRVPKLIHDTMWMVYDIPVDSVKLKNIYKVRTYTSTYRDSSIIVNVSDSILGYHLSQRVNYRLFVPKVIYDSTTITKTSLIAPKWEFKGGIDATPRNMFIDFELEKGRWSYNGGYDPFNKQVKAGVKYTISRR